MVSVSGGATGVRVAVLGDKTRTFATSDPVFGRQTDHLVTWQGNSFGNCSALGCSGSSQVNGAVALQFLVPADGIVFAFAMKLGDDDHSHRSVRTLESAAIVTAKPGERVP